MKPKCFGSRRRVEGCQKEAKSALGFGAKAKPFCGNDACKDAIVSYALEKSRKDKAKSDRAAVVDRNKRNAADKLRIETLRQACGKAQIDFNKLICTYDRLFYGECISGGGPVQEAGHLVHRGSKYGTSWLTFFHANLHGQSTHDNCFKGGEEYNYRRGLIKRHGKHWLLQVEKMKRLEDSGELPRPTKDEVRAMAKWCRAMTRIYEKMI